MTFATIPSTSDYKSLAEYVTTIGDEKIHPALKLRRVQIAERLTVMGAQPDLPENRSAYQMLRLFVY